MKRGTTLPILRASLAVLGANPRMLTFPLLATLGTIAALALVVRLVYQWVGGLGPSGLEFDALALGSGSVLRVVTVAYLAWLFQRLWSMAMRVALSRAAVASFRGEPWSVATVMRRVKDRMGAIATYVILEAGVQRILSKARKRSETRGLLGRVVSRAAEVAWWATSYFVIPILACEEARGFDAIKRSASLFEATWGRVFLGRLRVEVVWGLALVATMLGLILFGYLELEDPQLLAWLALPPLVIALPVAFVIKTLDTVYRSALYLFSSQALRPEVFEGPELDVVFAKSGESK